MSIMFHFQSNIIYYVYSIYCVYSGKCKATVCCLSICLSSHLFLLLLTRLWLISTGSWSKWVLIKRHTADGDVCKKWGYCCQNHTYVSALPNWGPIHLFTQMQSANDFWQSFAPNTLETVTHIQLLLTWS